MFKSLKKKKNELASLLTQETDRVRIQFIAVYIIFAIVSLVMTIINICTSFSALMWATASFTILMIVDIIMSIKRSKSEHVARWLFSGEIIVLFTFFIIMGEPEGFSALWCSILPLGGMLLYRRKNGTIISAIMLAIIIFCFWIPWKRMGVNMLQYDYTDSFRLRYPVFYISCYGIGLLFETVRLYTHRELENSRNKFYELSYKDLLTGLNNRNSYEQRINYFENIKYLNLFIAFFDANGLHKLNDEKGHAAGDKMLICVANEIAKEFGIENSYRIGGDEFVVIISTPKEANYEEKINAVASRVAGFGYSVAKGMKITRYDRISISQIIDDAEKDMYKDKNEYYKKTGIDRRRD